MDLEKLLAFSNFNKASDLHFVHNNPPQMRIDGSLRPVEYKNLTGREIDEIIFPHLSKEEIDEFEEKHELDVALSFPKAGRFRANLYKVMGESAAAFRTIPTTVPSLDELKSPEIFKRLLQAEKGLILVTGATGSGKSTTISAMINEINTTSHKHIMTIEDPIEFVHKSKKSLISHRNVGSDTKSFATALKYALRQDPDVILVGEMRDHETIGAGLTIAETGHLVFGTLHTNSAPQSINRIIDVFETGKQNQVRMQLSTTLIAVISQVLVPKIGGGRKAIFEILINNSAIANLIRDSKNHQIYSQMQVNQTETGMKTQTQELLKAIQSKEIDIDHALKYSNNREELKRNLNIDVK
jgi:twitching motility protein PilT